MSNHNDVRKWEVAVEDADVKPLEDGLPDVKEHSVGEVFVEGEGEQKRKWVLVDVVGGSPGARWAYWCAWVRVEGRRRITGIGPNPQHKVIADKLFNGDAPHFVGMLSHIYAGKFNGVESKMWVLTEPKVQPPRVEYVREEKSKERYERSKEVFDVNTGETKRLP